MEFIVMVYLVVFTTMFGSVGIFVLSIAGKDMFFAIKRWAIRKGSDIYLINKNRNVSYFYKVPKDDVFKIGGKSYITNPDKVTNLSEIEKLQVVDSITKTTEKFKERIKKVDEKIALLNTTMRTLTKDSQKNTHIAEIARLNGIKDLYEQKLSARVQNYFKDKRRAFFYIEGDPVPKDMYEFYSEVDCQIMDNLVSRSISTPPELQDNKDLKKLKLLVLLSVAAGGIAVVMCFKLLTMVHGIFVATQASCCL